MVQSQNETGFNFTLAINQNKKIIPTNNSFLSFLNGADKNILKN
jgi:hypothetical protein